MGRNVFISYRYGDCDVHQFPNSHHETTSRDYVNVIKKILEETQFYYFRAERDGDDLTGWKDDEIKKKLADLMFYTSITIVLITPRMFKNISERNQWIPWEISYSLGNKQRATGTSNMNAILAVVIPDRKGSYRYALHRTKKFKYVREEAFFEIILRNMFNKNDSYAPVDEYGNRRYIEGDSYIALATWGEFCNGPEYYLDVAINNRGNWNQYQITKRIDKKWIS